ncbi:MAG: sigma-70 family RNA polymerase sigma factor [Bacilli bacterium]|nr:sigma-70 family RNA polymerase sigma factor [Bacilli bacterium]
MKQEILKQFKEKKDEKLFIKLQEEYGGLVIYYAQKINNKTSIYGEELEDCIQQCWLCFLKAIDKYNVESGHAFSAFLVSCLTHHMLNHLRDFKRKRGNASVYSIDNYMVDDDSLSYLEVFESDLLSPSKTYEYKEVIEKFIKMDGATDLEKQIFLLHLKGYTYTELSKKYSISNKKIDNIIRKVKNILKEN